MLSTDERNKLAVGLKADDIDRRHRGKITINRDPSQYIGSIVTIPTMTNGCSAFAFKKELIDDTPGRPVRIASIDTVGGAGNGYQDIDDKLMGKKPEVKKQVKNPKQTMHARIAKRVDKAIESEDEQALDDFFASLLG